MAYVFNILLGLVWLIFVLLMFICTWIFAKILLSVDDLIKRERVRKNHSELQKQIIYIKNQINDINALISLQESKRKRRK